MSEKIVTATDTSAIRRFAKKYLGSKFLSDMTDKELQAVYEKPDSVFGKIKRQANVTNERQRRKTLLKGAYKDKILRDQEQKSTSVPKLSSAEMAKLKAFANALKKEKAKND